MQQSVCHMNSVNGLKHCPIEVWKSMQQNIIDAAINKRAKQLRAMRCMQMDNIFNTYCERM